MMGPALVRKEPVGVVGGIVPWNVPLFITMLKLAPALVAGCHDGAEAGARDAARRVPARRDRPRGRPARRRASTSSPPAARWASTSSPTRTSTRSRSPAAPPPAEASPRCAASASAGSPSSSAASRPSIILDDADLAPGRAGPRARRHHEQRPGVRRADPHPRQPRPLRRGGRRDRRGRRRPQGRRPARPRDRDRPARRRAPARPGRGLHRVRPGARAPRSSSAAAARPDSAKGWFVEPTVFADVDNDMRIAQEEIFGPVLSVIPYDDVDDAVAIANDSDYGLSGSVYGADVDTATRDRRPGPHRHDRRSTASCSSSAARSAGSRARASAASSGPKASRPTSSCSPSRSRPADTVEGANRLVHPAGVRRRLRRDLGHRRGPHQRRVPHLHLPPQRGRDRVALAGAALPAAPAGSTCSCRRACASTTRSTASTSASTRPTSSRRRLRPRRIRHRPHHPVTDPELSGSAEEGDRRR